LNGEKEQEIKYLQGQLEQLIGEKRELQSQLTVLEQEPPILKSDPYDEEMGEKMDPAVLKEMEVKLTLLRADRETYLVTMAELESSRVKISDLEKRVAELQLLAKPFRLPPCEPVLRLREMQKRIEALTATFRSY